MSTSVDCHALLSPMLARMRHTHRSLHRLALLGLLFGAASSACDAPHAVRANAGVSDAGRRLKPYTVTIEMLEVASRDLVQGDNGELVYGALTSLAGAEVCVAYRRAAFATFAPFERMATPICAQSMPGAAVRLEGVPANSDLLITVEKEGYGSVSLTSRTDTRDSLRPTEWAGLRTTLFRVGAVDAWLEPEPGQVADAGSLVFYGLMKDWNPDSSAIHAEAPLPDGVPIPGLTLVEGSLRLDPPDSGEPLTLPLRRDRPGVVSLAAGSYRAAVQQPAVHCAAVGLVNQYVVAGLPTGEREVIEVPVLAGYQAWAAPDCDCAWGPGDELEDLPTSTIKHSNRAAP